MAGKSSKRRAEKVAPKLEKAPTGIRGLDEITGGGLPKGRPTLITGGPGSGKTLFGMEFLVRGATDYNEPGVFIAFEETAKELAQNVESLGFNVPDLVRQNKLSIDYVYLDRREIEVTGEYDLEGLFIRLGYAIDSVGAKRVVLDTVEALFAGLTNEFILRSELRRLFRWLKEKGVTAVITAEQGENSLTRQGLEEYVSDCVIVLDHRVVNQIATRRLRVIKYRGTAHGTNEYPFLIDEHGFSVLPVTTLNLEHGASEDRISAGVPELDEMLGGKGYYRGSTVLVSGTAGTGKTSLAASFVNAACRRGERCVYFAFEESESEIMRNMKSIGIDLQRWVKKGLLRFETSRPTMYGLEMHLVTVHKSLEQYKPRNVVMDPITDFEAVSSQRESKWMLLRIVDLLKSLGATAMFTSLTSEESPAGTTEVAISSLIDTWVLLRNIEQNGERNRALYMLKSRGMAHSNQVREFVLTDQGVKLINVELGPEGVLTGSARVVQRAREEAERLEREQARKGRRASLEERRRALEARLTAQRTEFEAELQAVELELDQEELREGRMRGELSAMAQERLETGGPVQRKKGTK